MPPHPHLHANLDEAVREITKMVETLLTYAQTGKVNIHISADALNDILWALEYLEEEQHDQ